MRKMSLMKIKNFAAYAKKDLLMIIKKLEIIVILQENTEGLLITGAI